MADQRGRFTASNHTKVEFLKEVLALALTFCRIADSSPSNAAHCLRSAREAYESAIRYMFAVDMTHPDFDQVAANTERLKFLLDELEARYEIPLRQQKTRKAAVAKSAMNGAMREKAGAKARSQAQGRRTLLRA